MPGYKKAMKKRKPSSGAAKARKVALAGSPNAPYKRVPSAEAKKRKTKGNSKRKKY